MWKNSPVISPAAACRSRKSLFPANQGQVAGVLDVDSASLDAFDETDRKWLEEMVFH